MKKSTFLFILCLVMSNSLFAQGGNFTILNNYSNTSQTQKCVSDVNRSIMQQQMQRNIDSLTKAGALNTNNTETTVVLDWPIKQLPTSSGWYRNFSLSGYVDHDTSVGLQDFECQQQTYNGHMGTDIIAWPFPFHLMKNNMSEIIAAADGQIVFKHDGEADSNCNWNQGQQWNAVFVKHNDGSIAWYGHMKINSLTTKLVGQMVQKGEYLGVMGSSGRSNIPHLHLEMYDSLNNLIDPYVGNCNNTITTSCWQNQPPRRDPYLNTIFTHSAQPVASGCPAANEFTNFSNQYFVGDSVFAGMFISHPEQGDSVVIRFKKPDNSLYKDYSFVFPGSGFGLPLVLSDTLPPDGPFGTYTLEVDFNGVTRSHNFNYGYPVGINETYSKQEGISISPNPVKSSCLIHIDNQELTNVTATLYNLVGLKQSVVFEKANGLNKQQTLNLIRNGQASGIYILQLKNENGIVLTRKLMFD